MKRRALRFALIGVAAIAAWIVVGAHSLELDASPSDVMMTLDAPMEEVLLATSAETGTTCPNVSCLTEQGYYECISCAGCTCDPMNDFCVPEPPPPPPKTECPNVSCLSQEGYYECISCPGCECHPQTDRCYGTPDPGIGVEENPYIP